MQQNQLSRYGAISRMIPNLAPGAKVFLVSDSDDTNTGAAPAELGANFPVDEDGVVRVYTTIQDAVNAAAASRGDVVLVAPGYDHTLSRVDTWATAGVKVIGLGEGFDRPTVRFGAATDAVHLGASNITVQGLRFLADADSVAVGVDLDTGFEGAVIRDNVWDYDSNAMNFKRMLHVGHRKTLVEGNDFLAEDTIGAGAAISLDGGNADFVRIRDNYIYGQFDTNGDTTNGSAAISIDVTHDSGDTIISGVEIYKNRIVATDTAAAVVFNLAGGAATVRGLVSDNRFASYDTAAADTVQMLFGTAMATQNWFVDADSDTPEELLGVFTKFTGVQSS